MRDPEDDPPPDGPNPRKTSTLQPKTNHRQQPKITSHLTHTTAHPLAENFEEKPEKMTTYNTNDPNTDRTDTDVDTDINTDRTDTNVDNHQTDHRNHSTPTTGYPHTSHNPSTHQASNSRTLNGIHDDRSSSNHNDRNESNRRTDRNDRNNRIRNPSNRQARSSHISQVHQSHSANNHSTSDGTPNDNDNDNNNDRTDRNNDNRENRPRNLSTHQARATHNPLANQSQTQPTNRISITDGLSNDNDNDNDNDGIDRNVDSRGNRLRNPSNHQARYHVYAHH